MAKFSLYNLEYTIIDFETTGLDPQAGAEIVEIGALRIRGDKLTGDTFQTLINIEKPMPKSASAVHGITDKDLKGKPTLEKVWPEFLSFIGNRMLIAHNAEFDLGFVKKAIERFPHQSLTNHCIDTLQVSRQLFSYEKGHSLDAISKRFGLRYTGTDRHRSMGDCHLTAQVFSEFLKVLKRRKADTLHHIRDCIFYPPKVTRLIAQENLKLF